MALSLTQNYTAVVPNSNFAQFVATGGVSPYTYSILSGVCAGGVIDSSTGSYTAPSQITAYPALGLYDTIQVTDSTSAVATATILVGTPLFLLCDILQTQLSIPSDHIFLWNQKIFQPTDSNLYCIVSVPSCRPFGNNRKVLPADGSQVQQYVSMYAKIDIDIISRGTAARDQKELVPLALNSIYSQQQQQANGFYISQIPIGFQDLSHIDGAAIPYRYKLSFAMQYVVSLIQSVPYFDTFQTSGIYTNP